jgi:hypothetical protein
MRRLRGMSTQSEGWSSTRSQPLRNASCMTLPCASKRPSGHKRDGDHRKVSALPPQRTNDRKLPKNSPRSRRGVTARGSPAAWDTVSAAIADCRPLRLTDLCVASDARPRPREPDVLVRGFGTGEGQELEAPFGPPKRSSRSALSPATSTCESAAAPARSASSSRLT